MIDYINFTDGSLYGNYRTRTFADIFKSADNFYSEYNGAAIPNTISESSCKTLFYLLYSKYGNWSIASSDENQFKYCIWTTIYKYGPTWEKRLEIQDKLRNLSDTELLSGSVQINNHAYAPGEAPSTQLTDELSSVDDQRVSKYQRSKLDAYEYLYGLLKTDVTTEFINQFKGFFNPFAVPQLPLYYISED